MSVFVFFAMGTKTELIATWSRWTGDPEREVRHRVRTLSEAGLLPQRANPLTIDDFTRFLIAMVGSETHKDAPDAVRLFSTIPVSYVDGPDTARPWGNDLFSALKIALLPPNSILSLEISRGSSNSATIEVFTSGKTDSSNVDKNNLENLAYINFDTAKLSLDEIARLTVFKPIISRKILFPLIQKLLLLIHTVQPTENDYAGSVGAEPAHSGETPTALAGQSSDADKRRKIRHVEAGSQLSPRSTGSHVGHITDRDPPWNSGLPSPASA